METPPITKPVEPETDQQELLPLGILQGRLLIEDRDPEVWVEHDNAECYFVITDSTDPERVVAKYDAQQVAAFLSTLTMASNGFPRLMKWYDGFCRTFVRNNMTSEFRHRK